MAPPVSHTYTKYETRRRDPDPRHAALLVIDLQGHFASLAAAAMPAIAATVALCRSAGIPVVYTRHIDPVPPSRPLAEWWPGDGDRIVAGTPAAELLPGAGRVAGVDMEVEKSTYSAFDGTGLEETQNDSVFEPAQHSGDTTHSYHIVALIDSSRPNTQVQFLIQDADGYVAAVRVVSRREERSTTGPWYAFSGMVIPAHIPSIMTQYSSSYSEIEKAQVGDNIFQRIYKFYHRFNDLNFVNLPTDPLSDVYSQSLFVLLGEGQRFGVARRRFIFLHLANPKVEHPSAPMTILFRNWSSFSKACLCQYLADLEAELGMNNDETKRQAMTMWKGLKRRFAQLVNFGDGGQESILSALLEDELYMLKSDDDREKLFIKVMMRLGGHNDQFVIPW